MRPSFPLAACIGVALTACAPHVTAMPKNVTVAQNGTLPAPQTAANNAPPVILAADFSSLDIKRPVVWSGTIVTTTNVASVELKTNQFSISVPRDAFGHFHFNLNVYDVPPEFVRSYVLRIIARNSAGTEQEEDVPMQIR